MTQRQLRWHQALRSLLIGGVLLISPLPAIAQLRQIADDTLGTERSLVTPFNPAIDVIDGGARRGGNLFHSFREFNIDVGRSVYFTNPAGVTNILTRVTSGNPSQILGTLGVLGNANLFLLNPNGILFGANARLDLRGGSFLASTANSLVFNNGFAFSATNPQAPPLLTVNVPIGLQYGSNPGAIQVQGSFLQVPDGQTLTLAGGAVNVDGAGLFALGGRVELAGVADAGVVGLTQQGQEWRLSVPDGLARADVAIGNDAFVDVSAGRGGGIAITGRNLTVTGSGTRLVAGIRRGFGTVGAQAGNIAINATETTQLDGSGIINAVLGTGNAGDINITTKVLSLTNGAALVANTFRQGSAGNITIAATDAVFLDGAEPGRNGMSSSVASQVSLGAIGQGGNISITTGRLAVTNGARIDATAFGRGNPGVITITAKDAVFLDGVGRNGTVSGITNVVGRGVTGQGSDIRIATGVLSLANGAQVGTTTFGQGNAGNIIITAKDRVSFDGVSSNGFYSIAASNVDTGATGQGGDIIINTGALSFSNGATIEASTFGRGKAGNIIITAREAVSFDGGVANRSGGAFSRVGIGAIGQGGDIRIATGTISLMNGAQVISATSGRGESGNITITARDGVSFDGVGSRGLSSGTFSGVAARGTGRGGDISIAATELSLTNGAVINTATFGQGGAGNITITTKDRVSFDGVGSNGFASGASSTVESGAIGQGGKIGITAGTLTLTNGGVVSAATSGQGNAGDIIIAARDGVLFDGVGSNGNSSGTLSSVKLGADGQGGTIKVNSSLLSITNRGQLSASSEGQGDAGNINVTARQLRLDNQGSIQAQTASGQGGNINLQIQDYLLLRRGSSISTTAGTAQAGGDGGNISFNGKFIVAVPNENSDISANAFTGSGGRVNITAQGIFGIQFRSQLTPLSDITASSDFGVAGVVAINTPNVDPNRGLVQLPVDLTDASRLIVQDCPTGDSLAKPPNQFIVTGRGGLPPTPSEAVNRDAIQVDLVTADVEDAPSVSQNQPNQHRPDLSPESLIVEAQGLRVAADGTVFLVAAESSNPMVQFRDRLIHCHQGSKHD